MYLWPSWAAICNLCHQLFLYCGKKYNVKIFYSCFGRYPCLCMNVTMLKVHSTKSLYGTEGDQTFTIIISIGSCSMWPYCLFRTFSLFINLCFQIVSQYDNVILRYSIKLLFRRLYKAFLHELAFSVCISLNEGNIGVLSSKMGDDVDWYRFSANRESMSPTPWVCSLLWLGKKHSFAIATQFPTVCTLYFSQAKEV